MNLLIDGAELPSRRRMLQYGATTVLAVGLLSSCERDDPPSAGGSADQPASEDELEAPTLVERVAAGDLPPLAERLPDSPLVVEPVDEVGVYGGTWHNVLTGPGEEAMVRCKIGYDQLLHWAPDWSEVVPNIAESVDVEAGRIFVFALRQGMRWSDGEPFTSADIVFAIEDVFLNEELSPIPPSWLLAGDQPPVVEALDDHTIRLEFAEPHGLFLDFLASPSGTALTGRPRHYLEQFHAEYNPDVEELVDTEGFDDWIGLFHSKSAYLDNPELPTLWAWQVTSGSAGADRFVAERNPYYWKVDTEGRQLPYLDEVSFDIVSDPELILLKVANGEYDMEFHYVTKTREKPVLARNREEGNYEFFDMIDSSSNDMQVGLNQTHEDKTLREVFRSKDFRIGLSYAINRQEIIGIVYQRQGEPYQVAPRPESDFYDEEFAKQYTEFDTELANRHLDQAGFTDRDGQGFRLAPNGERIFFTVDVVADRPWWIDSLELIKEDWAAVGIDMSINSVDRTLFGERRLANACDAAAWTGEAGLYDGFLYPKSYLPFNDHAGVEYAVGWAQWYMSDGTAGEPPPDPTRRQMELYDELQVATEPQRRDEIFREILSIAKDEFYVIGTVLPQRYGVVRNDFHNVPTPFFYAWQYLFNGPTRTEQYFTTRGVNG